MNTLHKECFRSQNSELGPSMASPRFWVFRCLCATSFRASGILAEGRMDKSTLLHVGAKVLDWGYPRETPAVKDKLPRTRRCMLPTMVTVRRYENTYYERSPDSLVTDLGLVSYEMFLWAQESSGSRATCVQLPSLRNKLAHPVVTPAYIGSL